MGYRRIRGESRLGDGPWRCRLLRHLFTLIMGQQAPDLIAGSDVNLLDVGPLLRV